MDKKVFGKITKVSGPLIEVEGLENAKMFDVVLVGERALIGEIVEIHGGTQYVQVYEETSGLGPGDKVENTFEPLCVELAPGLVGGMFDGIARPLDALYKNFGNNITRGAKVDRLNTNRKWHFFPLKKAGDEVRSGEELGFVEETSSIKHKILVPIGINGKIKSISSGEFTILDKIAKIETENGDKDVCMLQKWPVRVPRPKAQKKVPTMPMITGQRVIDTLFPIARGGVGAVPGPFGSGKTVVQHQLAKWADADLIVYIGCGERGNEMTDVLNEFPTILDPKSGKPLMQKTVLIANTSDMPVSAREASIYTGITIAEYFRDMGYNVAIMADSTSRWAEALREMSSRLEEMPGEEGYPAYLSSRLAEFYERAGVVQTLGGNEGSVTVVGAVSPPGGDMSEPVSQATLRIVKVFWCLSSALAYSRHYPAIDWSQSYSLYAEKLKSWFADNVSPLFSTYKNFASLILQQEGELLEIVRLIGSDTLSFSDRILLKTAKMLREDFLQQDAFDKEDSFSSINKQFYMLKLIYTYYTTSLDLLPLGADIEKILNISSIIDISKSKFIAENNLATFDKIISKIKKELQNTLPQQEEEK